MEIFLMLLVLSFIIAGAVRSVPITKTVYDSKLRTEAGTHFGFAPLKSIPFLGLAAATFVLFLSFVTVDAGNVGIVKKFGNPIGQLGPGAHLIMPYENVTPVTVQTRIVHPNTQSSSLDLQVVHTEVTLQYHVDPAYATFILVELNNDAEERIIDPAILESIKAVTAKYDAQQLIAQRVSVRDGIETLVRQKLSVYHLIAENLSITNFNFSDEYNKAIEAKVTAQQHSEQATNDLKRIQIEEVGREVARELGHDW